MFWGYSQGSPRIRARLETGPWSVGNPGRHWHDVRHWKAKERPRFAGEAVHAPTDHRLHSCKELQGTARDADTDAGAERVDERLDAVMLAPLAESGLAYAAESALQNRIAV